MDKEIQRRTEVLPGIFRQEIYTVDDLAYKEYFDDETGKRLYGHITMYNGVKVCNVLEDGTISLDMPLDWVVNHKLMLNLISDLTRLDDFLSMIYKDYCK